MIIAVELNNIIRDFNNQVLKYYCKEYDEDALDDVDLKCTDLLSVIPFESQEARKTFKEIDYPYELYGCAKTMHKHLHVELSDWLDEHEDIEIIYFSLNESDLMVQSTYFFLSKGSRVRTMIFPKKPEEIWNYCDVAVTLNKKIVDSKPQDKKVIVIKKSDNKQLQNKANLVYNDFISILKDEEFEEKIRINNKQDNKIKTYFKVINNLWKKI